MIANITYTVCGTELIALLLESSEIKRLYPIYNHAQKYDRGNYILTDYFDQKGIRHILFSKNHKSLNAISTFKSFDAAREFMFSFIEEHELCPKYCGMQTADGACFDYQVKKCRGVCNGTETAVSYNKRLAKALKKLSAGNESRVIIDEGRAFNERSVVLIENGIYKGFGYFENDQPMDVETAKEIIEPFRHTADVQNILARWMNT